MISYRVRHETTYLYGDPVVTSHNEAHLKPRQLGRQAVGRFQLEIQPPPSAVAWRQDYFGNDVAYFGLERPHERLRLVATSTVEVADTATPPPEQTRPWETVAAEIRSSESPYHLDAFPFALDSTLARRTERLESFARISFGAGRPVLDATVELAGRIFGGFRYAPGSTQVSTPAHEVLENRRGVCQDFAHLMIGCLRSIGLPARYVSGYVRTDGSPRAIPGQATHPDLIGGHASHAWVAVFCGEAGWIEIDPTNDLIVTDQHIVLGWGRDYDDVSPLRGVTLGGHRHTVSVRVEIDRKKPR